MLTARTMPGAVMVDDDNNYDDNDNNADDDLLYTQHSSWINVLTTVN